MAVETDIRGQIIEKGILILGTMDISQTLPNIGFFLYGLNADIEAQIIDKWIPS